MVFTIITSMEIPAKPFIGSRETNLSFYKKVNGWVMEIFFSNALITITPRL